MKVFSPISGSENIILLDTISSAKLISAWEEEYRIDISSEFQGCKEIKYYQCCDTGLKFFLPLDVYGSEQLYKHLEKFEWYYMAEKWEHSEAVKDLDNSSKVLEVGCGKGAFVQHLCQRLNLDVQGIELNSSAVLSAQASKIPVFKRDVYKLAQEKTEFFDAVCTFQVLEHVPKPKEFINALISLLKPGGKLIISVPNSQSLLGASGDNLLDMPPHHMTQWDKTTFQSLQTVFPIEVRRFKEEPLATYHVDWYLKLLVLDFTESKLIRKLLNKVSRYSIRPFLYRLVYLRSLISGHTLYVCFEKLQ